MDSQPPAPPKEFKRAKPLYGDVLGALYKDRADKVHELLDAGVDVNSRNDTGNTILILAIKNNKQWRDRSKPVSDHINCLRILIDRGADVEARNDMQSTALHWACANGFPDVVRLLLEHGADIHARDIHGTTPLMEATIAGHAALAGYLIEQGARRNEKDNMGVSASARAENGHNEPLKAIFKAAASTQLAEKQGVLKRHAARLQPRPTL